MVWIPLPLNATTTVRGTFVELIYIYIYMSELRLVYSICEWHRSKCIHLLNARVVNTFVLAFLYHPPWFVPS